MIKSEVTENVSVPFSISLNKKSIELDENKSLKDAISEVKVLVKDESGIPIKSSIKINSGKLSMTKNNKPGKYKVLYTVGDLSTTLDVRIVKVHNFEKSIQVGASGEQMVFKHLSSFPYPLPHNFDYSDNLLKLSECTKVKDVANNTKLQKADIDFIMKHPDGEALSIELKTDTQGHLSGNMSFELTTGATPGCFLSSQADVFMYLLVTTQTLFVFDKKELENTMLRASKQKLGFTASVKNNVSNNKNLSKNFSNGYYASNYLVPIKFVLENCSHLRFKL